MLCVRPGSGPWLKTVPCNPPFSTSATWRRSRNSTPGSASWSAATLCWRRSGRASAKLCCRLRKPRSKRWRRRQNGRRTAGEKNIDKRADRAVVKMKKHFILEIARSRGAGTTTASPPKPRSTASTSFEPVCEQLDAGDTVAAYKNLSTVECAFRTFKIIGLNVRPHRLENRVRAPALHAGLLCRTRAGSSRRCCSTTKTDRGGP